MRNAGRRAAMAIAGAMLVCAASSLAAAQTVDEILARNYQARGGLEKLKALTSVKMVGTVSGGGGDMTVTTWSKRPNLVRQEQEVGGNTIVQAFDGTYAWTINPMQGSSDPTTLPAAQADAMKAGADFDGVLIDYKAKGHTIVVEGPDTVEGAKVFRLKVTAKNGLSQYLYLDATTGLEHKVSAEVDQGGRQMTVETILSDYKPVSGIVVPFSFRRYVNGQLAAQITFRSIEFDVAMDESLFRMPKK